MMLPDLKLHFYSIYIIDKLLVIVKYNLFQHHLTGHSLVQITTNKKTTRALRTLDTKIKSLILSDTDWKRKNTSY